MVTPVPTAREPVTYKASQAALRASMSAHPWVPHAERLAEGQRLRKERTLRWTLASDRFSRNNSFQQASLCLAFCRRVFY